ncbi:hypothetical protein Psta_4345 [Pirellula staleyi DSM 6068]|uniref:Uncharacterized protein n=1 Tax=Pirellula staleyi (strain ATCC 27377 / DSM 6068 / ICPB 4128) TaxID=530564 RepID=D2R530_PIRSD|nr:hypothetical protein [Pirellula staleyi]ADB18992.1 hypothetical protein Psta_4345 [Pirellula staleyi DSM 6068]
MKPLSLLGSLFAAFCIGTVVSLFVLAGVLWSKGFLTGDRMTAAMAAFYGIQPKTTAETSTSATDVTEQPALDDLSSKRVLASLDLDLRENAIDKSLGDLRALQTQIKTERERLDQWKMSFDQRLATLETATTDSALAEVQRTLESMQPKQAKEQILKMLEASPRGANDKPMRDIVTIIKALPLDRRKKILLEFKTPDEAEKLAEILREIRLGTPDIDVIRDSRNQLQQTPSNR